MALFTVSEIVGRLGDDWTERTVRYYQEIGLVIPEVNPSGKGKAKLYSKRDVFRLVLARTLSKVGFDLGVVRSLFETMDTVGLMVGAKGSALAILDGHTAQGGAVFKGIDEDGKVAVSIESRDIAVILNLTKIESRVDALLR